MQDRIELDLNEIFKIMNKKKIAILGITGIVALVTIIVNLFVLTPVYESKVSIVAGPENLKENIAYAYSSDTVVLSQKLIKTYSEIATSDTVLKKTVKDLKLGYNDEEYENFKKRVIVTTKENTQVLEIAVRDENPSKAALIANQLTKNFIKESRKFLPLGEMKLLDEASAPNKAIKPNKTLNVAVATVLTFISVATFIVLKELKRVKIVDETDVEKYLDLKVVGTIRQMNS